MSVIALLVFVLLLSNASAWADVVTVCSSDTQGGGTNLAQALQQGGTITFRCPENTVISVTQGYTLKKDTVIDGDGRVTLDGHGLRAKLLDTASRIVLRRLTIRGMANPVPFESPWDKTNILSIPYKTLRPGSVLTAYSDVELDQVSIQGSETPVVIRGNLTMSDSTFTNNSGTALLVEGVTSIVRGWFMRNDIGIIFSRGRLNDTTFSGQKAGAVWISVLHGPVEILHSVFTGTRGDSAITMSKRAAVAHAGPARVTLRANRFDNNDGGNQAGAIRLLDPAQQARDKGLSAELVKALESLPPVGFTLAYNRFRNNRGASGGAARLDLHNTAGMTSTGDLFVDNTAIEGGAIALSSGSLLMTHALFRGNHATRGQGAAIVVSGSKLTLANSLVVRNSGPTGAVRGNTGGIVALANVTIADNNAVGLSLNDGGGSSVVNTIMANNRPADCEKVRAGTFKGSNMQSAATCPGAATGEAFLDSLYIPASGSPALQLGDPGICAAAPVKGSDLVFTERGLKVCALGAFEHAPQRNLPRIDEPVVPHAGPVDEWPDPDDLAKLTGAPPATLKSPIEPIDAVLAALATEEAVLTERVRLRVEWDRAVDIYLIDRLKAAVGPPRVHLVKNPGAMQQEMIAVNGIQWLRTKAGWERSPVIDLSALGLSGVGLFRNGLTEVVEHETLGEGDFRRRRFSAQMAWSNGGVQNTGRLALSIDGSGRPSAMVFDGRCGIHACSFRQTFDYKSPVTIEEPRP